MKLLCLTLTVLFSAQIFAFEDLGVHGREYDIVESPLVASIKKEIAKLDPEDMKKQIASSVSSAYIADFRTPVCTVDNFAESKNFMHAPQDVLGVGGKKLLAKGERIDVNLPKGVVEDICFVDGSDFNTSLKEIELLREEQGCRVIALSNRNVKEYETEGFVAGRDIFPFSKVVWDRFNLECMPSVLHLESSSIDVYEYRSNYLEAKGL